MTITQLSRNQHILIQLLQSLDFHTFVEVHIVVYLADQVLGNIATDYH